MGIPKDPFDPEKHDRKEPEGAGVLYWTTQAAKIAALLATHGEMLNGTEAARFLAVSRQRVMELQDKGTIRGFAAGRQTFYPLADLRAWIDRRNHGPALTGRGHKAAPVFTEALPT